MKQYLKKSVLLLLSLLLLLTAIGCVSQHQEESSPSPSKQPAEPDASQTTAQTGEAQSQGFAGLVTVSVTVEDGVITAVTAEGEHETEAIGGRALKELPEKMLEANSVEVDTIAGATATSNAVLSAAQAAYAAAMGEEAAVPAEVHMAPGTYTGYGRGYSRTELLTAEVTVSETRIESIELNTTHNETAETSPIYQSVADRLVPRMIEHQSVRVDSITGATASSNGVKEAVEAALAEALAAGGSESSAIEHFYTVPAKVTGVTEELSTDVLVVGMGGAGISAATRAAEVLYAANGEDPSQVHVLAIDKAGKYGGTSSITDEPMAINPPKFQEEHNNGEDYVDAAAMKEAWLAYTKGDAKEECVDLMFEYSGIALDWLVEHGFVFGEPLTGFNPETDIWRCKYQYTGASGNTYHITATYFDSFVEDFESLGGEYMLETEAYELLYDESTNTVTGAKARSYDGTEYIITAQKVILATGGFGGNPEMEDEYISTNPYFDFSSEGGWGLLGSYQNDGAGVRMALSIGAGTYNIGMSPMVHQCANPVFLNEFEIHLRNDGSTHMRTGRPGTWSLNDVPLVMVSSKNVFSVDKYGERFCNEAGTWQWWRAGPIFYSIWSDSMIQYVKENGFDYATSSTFLGTGGVPTNMPIPEIYDVLDAMEEAGILHRADTLAELAELLGMDPETLENSVARYNELCAKGVDEDFGKAAEFLYPIGEEGPFYAVTGASYCYGTCAGLDVDDQLRVLMEDGETPIGGLYCAGSDCMGVLFTESEEYVTYGGACQGWGYTSGMLAGQNAAESLLG